MSRQVRFYGFYFLWDWPGLDRIGFISGTLYTHWGRLRLAGPRERRVGVEIAFRTLAKLLRFRRTRSWRDLVVFLG
jgi:hypothetical protein